MIEKPQTGWQLSSDGPYSCALDIALDRELRSEGLERELARGVNDLRRRADLRRADRITLGVAVQDDPGDEIAAMLDGWLDKLAKDVGAAEVTIGGAETGETLALGQGRVRVVISLSKSAAASVTGEPSW